MNYKNRNTPGGFHHMWVIYFEFCAAFTLLTLGAFYDLRAVVAIYLPLFIKAFIEIEKVVVRQRIIRARARHNREYSYKLVRQRA